MQEKPKARRRVLKAITTTGGITALTPLLPSKWTSPLLNWVVLPAHAQTSESVSENAEFLGIAYEFSPDSYEFLDMMFIDEVPGEAPTVRIEHQLQRPLTNTDVGFSVSFENQASSTTEGDWCASGSPAGDWLRLSSIDAGMRMEAASVVFGTISVGCELRYYLQRTLFITGSRGTVFTAVIPIEASASPVRVAALPATFVPV
ncbi:MAG: hypothetical protein ACRBHB_25145 [Arenicella sp.]